MRQADGGVLAGVDAVERCLVNSLLTDHTQLYIADHASLWLENYPSILGFAYEPAPPVSYNPRKGSTRLTRRGVPCIWCKLSGYMV